MNSSRYYTLIGLLVVPLCSALVQDVVIAGGGLAGLATAVGLRHLGAAETVQILEASSAKEFADCNSGAAAQLTPNGLRALRALGGDELLQRVLDNSSEVRRNAMILPSKKKLYDNVQEVYAGPPSDLPTVMIKWGLLRQFLADLLPADSTQFNQKLLAHRSSGERIRLELDNAGKYTSRTVKRSDTLIIAADGKRSKFRPTPLGAAQRVNIKAVVPKAVVALPNGDETTYSLFSPTGVACFVGPAGKGWTYWAISVATTDEDMKFYKENGASNPMAVKNKLLQVLRDADMAEAKVFQDLIRATKADKIFVQPSAEAELPESLQSDGIVLVGDAAHAMSASYGQCISFGLEDAATLAHVLSKEDNVDAALENYSRLRRGRCLEMQRKSEERAVKAMKGEVTDEITSWIHDWDVDFVPSKMTAIW